MSTFAGKDGVVQVGANAVAEVRSWSVDAQADTTEDTVMGDDWKSFKSIQKSWSGSLECYFDDTDANGQVLLVEGAEVTLSLLMEGSSSGSHQLTGSAIITGRNISQDMGGVTEVSFSFQGNGELTEDTVV